MLKYPQPLLQLIAQLKNLPGVGTKTAERFAFELLAWEAKDLALLGQTLQSLKEKVQQCPECHCLLTEEACTFCNPHKREFSQLCIVSSARDVYAFEETRTYRGFYHVLDALLSPLEGRGPADLNLHNLLERIATRSIQEVIIALDSTLEGDATALYLKDQLDRLGLRVSRLAFGLPMGSPLEYVDGGTLSRALLGRQRF